MAIAWSAVLHNVPWGQVIAKVPKVVDNAKRLRRMRTTTTAAGTKNLLSNWPQGALC